MEVLRTENISKRYKTNYAVKDVNMHINEGDIYGFVGENGAGKTTIIRMITGLTAPSKGNYYLFGEKNTSAKITDSRKNIAAIVETPSLNKSMNAYENLKYQSLVLNIKPDEAMFREILHQTGLDFDTIKDKKVKNYSLGMRQRLGIALTLLSQPKFIVLDEPMNGLDPKGFIEVRELIESLHQKGITFLISSHILDELQKVCTKIGFISHGHLVEELTTEELHAKAKKSIDIQCDDLEKIQVLLKEKLNIIDTTIEKDKLRLFEGDINQIIHLLVEENIVIKKINCVEDSIETYYLKLMRGVKND